MICGSFLARLPHLEGLEEWFWGLGRDYPFFGCSSREGSSFVTYWGLGGPVTLLMLDMGGFGTPLGVTQGVWPALLVDLWMWSCCFPSCSGGFSLVFLAGSWGRWDQGWARLR